MSQKENMLCEAVQLCFQKFEDQYGQANLRKVSLEMSSDDYLRMVADDIGCLDVLEKVCHELTFDGTNFESYKTYVTWDQFMGKLEDKGFRIQQYLEIQNDPVETTAQHVDEGFQEYRDRLTKIYGESEFSVLPSVYTPHVSLTSIGGAKYMDIVQANLDQISLIEEAMGEDKEALMQVVDERMAPKDKHLNALSEEEIETVERGMQGNPSAVVIDAFNVQMLRQKLQSLLPRQWLVDEPINFYFQLMEERDKRNCAAEPGRRRNFFMNSFFLNKLFIDTGYNYAGVRRWTKRKKIDIFSGDKVFIPVNVGNMHWCLAVIHIVERKIQYYDSMGGTGMEYLRALSRYIQDEMKDKKGQSLDITDWDLVPTQHDTPQQRNGYDCGVFTCMCADYLSENYQLSFTQEHMSLFRNRITLSILQCEVS